MKPTKNILLVEDDDAVREALEEHVLTSAAYRVVGAIDCANALSALEHEHFDLILLDITLPDRSGLEVLKVVREKYPTTKVIVLTGTEGYDYSILSRALGVQDYIRKPFSTNYLLKAIEYALSVPSPTIESAHQSS
jgi:two-component system alkaline phosphatase synthesis response regulator PhoP